jgi:Mrp family chromosome partitioning ATPase
MRAPQTSNPFDLVRATIEAELAAPGVLAVTSALSGDGKTGIAAGLARSLAGAPTHLVTRRTSAGCDVLSILPAEARIASALAIATLYEAVRAHYDFAIVDAAVFTDGGLAFARGADGVVLALREGRAVAAADRDAVDLFERLRVRVLGVVATRGDRSRGTGVAPSLVDRLHAQPRSVPTVSANTVRAAGLARLFSRSPV